MKKIKFILLIIGVALLSSCSLKVPEPQDSMKGIVAIPLEITNRTGAGFSYYYKFICTAHPDVVIDVFPSIGTELAYSDELVPGEYLFDQIKIIHKQVNAINKSSIQPILLGNRAFNVKVQPNTVTIVNSKLVVKQFSHKTESRTIQTNWDLISINDYEMALYVNNFKSLENSNKWKVVSAGNFYSSEKSYSSSSVQQKKDLLINRISSDEFTKLLRDELSSKGISTQAAQHLVDCVQHESLQLIQNLPVEKLSDKIMWNQYVMKILSNCLAKIDT